MKLIIALAHVPNDAFEPVRAELIDLGVLRMTVSEVHSTSARSATALRYRGAPLTNHLRAELRIECVATETQSPAVIDVPAGERWLRRTDRSARPRGTASGIVG